MNNPMQMLSQLQQNPLGFLAQRKLNIPQNIANDPNKIIQHLMNTGQISQDQYNQAIQNAKSFGFKP
jgi:hypothetical protein